MSKNISYMAGHTNHIHPRALAELTNQSVWSSGQGSAWASEFQLTGTMWFCPKVPKDVGQSKLQGTLFSSTLSNSKVSLSLDGEKCRYCSRQPCESFTFIKLKQGFFRIVTPILTNIPVTLLTKLVCIANFFWGSSQATASGSSDGRKKNKRDGISASTFEPKTSKLDGFRL